MPVFQYFGWVGSFLLMTLLAANWCFPAPIAPPSDVPLDQKVQIRIHTDHKWPERVVLDTTRATLVQDAKADGETDAGESELPFRRNASPSTRSPRWRAPQGRVFDRPAPPRMQSESPRRSRKARHSKLAHACR